MASLGCQSPDKGQADSVESNADGGEFEGTITYRTYLTAKSDVVDETHLNALYGDTLTWYYSEGNYQWKYNGSGPHAVTYLANGGLEYTQRVGVDTLFAANIEDESRTLDSLYVTEDTRIVLDRSCKILVVQVGRTRHTYCVDDQLRIDPIRFKRFHYGFTADRFAALPGAYLQYTYESPIFVIKREAIEIERGDVSATQFVLPDWPVSGTGS